MTNKTAELELTDALGTFEAEAEARPIPITLLFPNPWNRGKGDPAELQKLADSIKQKGYLVPIIARPHPKQEGKFEIIAGEQRYHAGLLAGRTYIPGLVREDVTDQEVMELMEIENTRRTNPTPLQQAELISKYRKKGYDTKNLAAVIGEPIHIIRRREKLLELSPRWQKELAREGTPFALWTAAHLELIAMRDKKAQDSILDDLRWNDPGEMTPAALEEKLMEQTHELALAPWKLDDDTLIPKCGSCNACPKRTGAQPDLWGEVEGKADKDRCLDDDCFTKKRDAYTKRRLADLKKEHGEAYLIRTGHGRTSEANVLYSDQYSVRKTPNDKTKPAIWDDGEHRGQETWILIGKDKTSTRPNPGTGASRNPDAPKSSLAELKERREKRLKCFILDKLLEHVKSKELEWPAQDRELLITIAYVFGTDRQSRALGGAISWNKVHEQLKKPLTTQDLWERVRPVLEDQISSDRNSYKPDLKEAKEIAAITSFDMAAARKEAEEAIPVPASWAARAEEEKEAKKKKGGKKGKGKGSAASASPEDLAEDLADDDDQDNLEDEE